VALEGRLDPLTSRHPNGRNRRNLAVHQAVDEGRVAALLRTSIIAACKATPWRAALGLAGLRLGQRRRPGSGFRSPATGETGWRITADRLLKLAARPTANWRIRRADEGSSLVASTMQSRLALARVGGRERVPRPIHARSRAPLPTWGTPY
jgi:hypothetical protein